MKIIIDRSELVDERQETLPAHLELGIPTEEVIECAAAIVNEERALGSKLSTSDRHHAVQGFLGHYGIATGKSEVVAKQVAALESTIMETVEVLDNILTRTNQLIELYSFIEVKHLNDNAISVEVV